MRTADLADRLVRFTTTQLEELAQSHLPDLQVPAVFAGHRVGPDVRADLVYTLGWLGAAGVDRLAGRPVTEAISAALRPIDGPETNTFYSYRVAETVARFGPLAGNPLVAGWSDAEVANLATATDSTDWVELFGVLPANYAAVLLRCELGREALGIDVDATLLDDLRERTVRMLGRNPLGYLDDSEDGSGARYDIYTPDVYLFCEPFGDVLGDVWTRGMRNAMAMVADVCMRNGAAVCWGRSTAVLAIALTIELAALAATRPELDADVARWLALAESAVDHLPPWFHEGVSTAHQHRGNNSYRGPERRLQLTLDLLGKLAWSAAVLRSPAVTADAAATESAPLDVALDDRDRLITFDAERHAAVWTYRSRDAAFVLPFTGTAWSDYLPAPRNPGIFDVPVDRPLPTAVPVAHVGRATYVGGGTPTALTHEPGRVTAAFDGLLEQAGEHSQGRRLAGTREATWTVDRRTIHVTERLTFTERVPDALSVQVTEAAGRPLHVELWADGPHRTDVIDVSGMAENRSFWGELVRVHQLDVAPAGSVELRWSVTPKLRIATDDRRHHYHRSLYDPLADRVHDVQLDPADISRPRRLRAALDAVDIVHLHWPEWFFGPDPGRARTFVDALAATGTRLVWTQHNLVPHHHHPAHEELYGVIAGAADAVIHHSSWGRERALARYRYGAGTRHAVIPHGHFGDLTAEVASLDRAKAEAELGLRPTGLRLGIVGAPRPAKHTVAFAEAFAGARRTDVQLLVLSLAPGEQVPDDPRITAEPYTFVPRDVYNRRLATIDVLVLPFDPEGEMLTTGVIGDAVALGLPVIASSWAFLDEVLGDAALRYPSLDAVPGLVDGLTDEQLTALRAAAARLQDEYAFKRVAEQTWALLEDVGTTKL